MPRGSKLMLSFANWPTEDRRRWEIASIGLMKATAARTLHQQPVGRGGKAMGDSWHSSPLSTRVGLLLHRKHGSIEVLWLNMWCGAEGRAEKWRSSLILIIFAAR